MEDDLLTVEDLRISYPGTGGPVAAVRHASFTMGRERLGIVGESGSGKSTLGRALIGLLPASARVEAAALRFAGIDLNGLGEAAWCRLRGRRIAMVLQDPRFSLNPVMNVGAQIAEAFRAHNRCSRREAARRALEMLEAVRIRDADAVFRMHPHQVSGGMGQRIMIAMMLVCEPDLLIADEPTSALDVTVQGHILALLDDLVRSRGMGLILISHDLDLVAAHCDRALVMYGGRIVETCAAGRLAEARHPYTRGLLACRPVPGAPPGPLPQLVRDPAWLAEPGAVP